MTTNGLWTSLCLMALLGTPAVAIPPSTAPLPWIYWADNDADTINRMRTDGSLAEVLATGRNPLGLSVHKEAGYLYWVDLEGGGRVMRSDLEGNSPTAIFTQAGNGMGQVVVDAIHSHVYWVDGINRRIVRAGLSGENLTTIYQSTEPLNPALEIDAARGQLFFSTGIFDDKAIHKIAADGTGHVVIASTYAYSMGLDEVNQTVYTADWSSSHINSFGYDGQGFTQVVDPQLQLRDVQVLGDSLYYNDVRSELVQGVLRYYFQWVRSDLNGANPEVLHEVVRGQGIGPQDVIQFVLVVPEPSSVVLGAMALGMLVLGRGVPCFKRH
jgi:hypothetical protein